MTSHPTQHVMRRLRPRTLGQALVETALVAPFLVMLLLGGAQVGSIAYDQVSLDTAAREGARAGAASPTGAVFSTALNARWYSAGNPATYTYTCKAADFPVNPVCVGVVNSAGFLTQNLFTSNPCGAQQGCVTITVVPPSSLQAQRRGPPALRLVSAPETAPEAASGKSCTPGNQMEVDGTVSGIPSGQPAGALVDTKNSAGAPNNLTSSTPTYSWCVNASKTASNDTITAQIGPVGCGGYTGSVTVSVTAGGSPATGDITVSAEPACTTSTTSTTTTSSSTTTSSTTTSTTTSSALTGPATGCVDHPVDDSYYFTVSVTYPAPVFIPFINNIFQTSSGVRMITASVTFPVDPCTMTDFGKN